MICKRCWKCLCWPSAPSAQNLQKTPPVCNCLNVYYLYNAFKMGRWYPWTPEIPHAIFCQCIIEQSLFQFDGWLVSCLRHQFRGSVRCSVLALQFWNPLQTFLGATTWYLKVLEAAEALRATCRMSKSHNSLSKHVQNRKTWKYL